MPHDQDARRPNKPTPLRKSPQTDREQSESDDDGDWWESSNGTSIEGASSTAPMRKRENAKRRKSKRTTEEVHSFISMFVGSQAIGIPLAVIGVFVAPDWTRRLLALAIGPIGALAWASLSYFFLSGSPLLRILTVVSGGPIGLLVMGIPATIAMFVGDRVLRRFGYKVSPMLGFNEQDSPTGVSVRCSECRKPIAPPAHRIGFYWDCPHCGKTIKVVPDVRKSKQSRANTIDSKRVALLVVVVLNVILLLFLFLGGPKMLDRMGR